MSNESEQQTRDYTSYHEDINQALANLGETDMIEAIKTYKAMRAQMYKDTIEFGPHKDPIYKELLDLWEAA